MLLKIDTDDSYALVHLAGEFVRVDLADGLGAEERTTFGRLLERLVAAAIDVRVADIDERRVALVAERARIEAIPRGTP